jgi:hypothetical protein
MVATKRDQLHLSLATFSRIWKNAPVEVKRSTFRESHDLDYHIAGSEDDQEGYHGNFFPAKVVDKMSIEVKKHQLLEPEATPFGQTSPPGDSTCGGTHYEL